MRSPRRLIAGAIVATLALCLARRHAPLPFSRYVVDGPSMLPAYAPGERVLVNRLAYIITTPAAGDAVVVRDPQRPGHVLLKRVATPPAGQPAGLWVLGDNARESRDSRAFGPVRRCAIVGKAWFKY
jgi:nickel-type superoxide dismutase maturation protease